MTPLGELKLECDRLEKVRRAGKIRPDLNQQSVRPRIDAAAAQVSDPSLGVGGEGARAQRDADTGRRLSRHNIEDVGRDRSEFAHSPTSASVFTGARRNSRTVA